MTNNQRIVTDSTGRTYTITYNGNKEHSRITSIKDTTADRVVTYAYNGDFQLVSATSVSGGTETYEYDKKENFAKSQTVMMKSQIKFLIWNMGK